MKDRQMRRKWTLQRRVNKTLARDSDGTPEYEAFLVSEDMLTPGKGYEEAYVTFLAPHGKGPRIVRSVIGQGLMTFQEVHDAIQKKAKESR